MQDRSRLWRVVCLRLSALLVLIGTSAVEFAVVRQDWRPALASPDNREASMIKVFTWHFHGWRILRNEEADVTFDPLLGRVLESVMPGAFESTRERRTQFRGIQAWLHQLYLAAFGLGVAGLFLPSRRRRTMLVGALGIASILVFLLQLGGVPEGRGGAVIPGLGAWLAIAGFTGLIVEGLSAMRRRPDPAGPVFE